MRCGPEGAQASDVASVTADYNHEEGILMMGVIEGGLTVLARKQAPN